MRAFRFVVRAAPAVGVLLGALLCAPYAQAAEPNWTGSRFVYTTNGSSVADTLNVFGAGQHMPVRIDGRVAGVVSGRFDLSPARFLDMLGQSYGFVWYYDGAVLQVSPTGAQTQLAIRPNYLSAAALRAALEQSGVTDDHFPLRVDDAARTVTTFGPQTYVERIRTAAARFEGDAKERVHTTVRVFRVSNTNAADVTRVIDGRPVVVPGVATRLRQRFGQHAPLQQAIEFDAPLPAIEADATTNSILVRDKPERIDADGVLVADLDVQPQLVSVQAWVVDVDAGALATLRPALPPGVASGDGTGVADGAGALVAGLEALAKAQRAQIEVSQTAVTLDRSPAVIDRHEARIAASDSKDSDGSGDAVPDVWLSVDPTVDHVSPTLGIDLLVEVGRAGDGGGHRTVDENVMPGQGLVIAAPGASRGARERLVLLIPGVAA
jgi:type III secretion protein C